LLDFCCIPSIFCVRSHSFILIFYTFFISLHILSYLFLLQRWGGVKWRFEIFSSVFPGLSLHSSVTLRNYVPALRFDITLQRYALG
jgi:hypothetical protein